MRFKKKGRSVTPEPRKSLVTFVRFVGEWELAYQELPEESESLCLSGVKTNHRSQVHRDLGHMELRNIGESMQHRVTFIPIT